MNAKIKGIIVKQLNQFGFIILSSLTCLSNAMEQAEQKEKASDLAQKALETRNSLPAFQREDIDKQLRDAIDHEREDITPLLSGGANINSKLLFRMIDHYKIDDRIKKLLNDIDIYGGFDVNTQDRNGESLLSYALLYNGYWVPFLLDRKNIKVNLADVQGNTPLHAAAQSFKGGEIYIPDLIKHGAHINAQNNLGETPLMISARRQKTIHDPRSRRPKIESSPNMKAIELLIANKANPVIKDNAGKGADSTGLEIIEKYVKSYPASKEFSQESQTPQPQAPKKEAPHLLRYKATKI
jgi:ankyrin repeat protein